MDVRIIYASLLISQYLHKHNKQRNSYAGSVTVVLVVIGTPYILHIIGRKELKSLQRSRSKIKLPFFWAVTSLAHIFNIYVVTKLLDVKCYGNNTIEGCSSAFTHSYSHSLKLVS